MQLVVLYVFTDNIISLNFFSITDLEEEEQLETRGFFGIITTEFTPARGYFQVVDRRNIATLYPIITRCTRTGTVVYTNDWAAYRGMAAPINNVADHRILVHARNFVDPLTGFHTQEIKSCWNNL